MGDLTEIQQKVYPVSLTRCKTLYKHFLNGSHLMLPPTLWRVYSVCGHQNAWPPMVLGNKGQTSKVSSTDPFTSDKRIQWLLCGHHSCFGNDLSGAINTLSYPFIMLLPPNEPLCYSGCVHCCLNGQSTREKQLGIQTVNICYFHCFCDLGIFFPYVVSISVVRSACDLSIDSHLALESIYLRLFKMQRI